MTNLLLPPPTEPTPPMSSSSSAVSDIQSPAVSQKAIDPKQEEEWKNSLRNLETQIQLYKGTRVAGGSASERAAEDVAVAMEQVGGSHTDPKVKKHWKEKAKVFRAAGNDERDGILEEIGKGFLVLLTTPFVLVGAVLQAAGGILSGVGSILKGLGRLTRKLTYTGASKKEPTTPTD